MGWIAYLIAWLTATFFWTLTSASSAGRSPIEALPFGLLAMGSAAVMGVAVWRWTQYVAWNWRAPSFYAVHTLAMGAYTLVYATAWVWPDVLTGRVRTAVDALRSSPFEVWNLLMGSWLYVIVAGLSYAVRAQNRARAQEADAAEARVLAQAAQLAALRAQLNPHFLFNALHSLGALMTSDPVSADRALERLGDLLRYVLRADETVPLAQEWRFTQDYLAFEQLRLGERLRVDATADSDALAVMVPPLIFQPLVENAVRHGIAERPRGGHIHLRANLEPHGLVLRVSDDGRGGAVAVGGGLGLASVRRRLAARYGASASVSADTAAAWFTVTVNLPSVETDGRGAM
jgi:LytS/YehU family sensor histidine kinase